MNKGSKTNRDPEVNDVVLVDGADQLRLGRILSISDNKTSAEVRIGRKIIQQAIKNLKVLSFYREV